MNVLSWLDIERIVRARTNNYSSMPDGVTRINCFSEAVEVGLVDQGCAEDVLSVIAGWFEGRMRDRAIEMDIAGASVPVDISVEEFGLQAGVARYPLWSHVAYIGDGGEGGPKPSDPSSLGIPLAAFHSFKGGVGRTTALMTFVAAALASAKEKKKPIKIFVIDADTEAPGITYWLDKANRPDVSFIKFLEALKYSDNKSDVIEFFSAELKKCSIDWAGSELFFLPAYVREEDLLDTPILPEDIARDPLNPWQLTDCIQDLSAKLGADMAFVDLRAGLSELSSPVLFDGRVERFLVSTVANQSVSGISIILRNMAKLSHISANGKFIKHPVLITSLLTEQLRETEGYMNFRERMESSYVPAGDHSDDLISSSLSYLEAGFDPSFMSLTDIESIINLLRSSTLFEGAVKWLDSMVFVDHHRQGLAVGGNQRDVDDEAASLARVCELFEFAEKGGRDELLETETLKNFAKHFSAQLPNVISIGAKGAGKTFTFLQFCRRKLWNRFVEDLGQAQGFGSDVIIFPIRSSDGLNGSALDIVDGCRQELLRRVPGAEFSESKLKDRMEKFLHSGDKLSGDWVEFWVDQMAEILGCQSGSSLRDVHMHLENIGLKVLFIIDGVEDSFKSISQDQKQVFAVEAILELPNRIREIRNSNVGVIAFVREDYVRAVKTQNYAQFVDRFKPFQLVWNPHSFLQLAHWVCGVAKIIGASPSDSVSLSIDELVESLEGLWGKKLARDDAKEAYSARWVFAALSDFNGRLQARDLLRFLKHASESARGKRGSWMDRTLPPESIRDALRSSSAQKVEEAKAEYEALRDWMQLLVSIPAEHKRIPFDPRNVGLNDQRLLSELQAIGVVFEDKDKQENDRFYLPEIYRGGIGFESTIGARPRVQALLQKSLGKLPF